MEDPRITILGGGLSALYSFFGCLEAGYSPEDIEIVTSDTPIPVGAVFLYRSPITWEPVQVINILLGTCDGYARKQWGTVNRKTSAHKRFQGGSVTSVSEPLFDPEGLLQTLWGMVPRITRAGFLSEAQIDQYKRNRQAVICTFPHPLQRKRYQEERYLVRIPIFCDSVQSAGYHVVYNGLAHVPWVRQTLMPGRVSVEYPHNFDPREVLEIEQRRWSSHGRISFSNDLLPDTSALSWEERIEGNLLRVGRIACFDPKYLSFMAMDDTLHFLKEYWDGAK